ncbi:MAG: hypothetical protein HC830_14865 [Bacteroidetes bacterium]|nr:hypothetical protein [Bacteroidota bacterium]
MIRFSKLLFIFLAISLSLNAQNFYDEQHSAKFAEYLFQSQQYDLAAHEFERLLFDNNSNTSYQLKLLKSYRKSGNLSLAKKKISGFV